MLRANELRWRDMMKTDMTLTQVIQDYAADLRVQRKSPKTILFYEKNIRLFGRWLNKKGFQCVLGDLNLRTAKLYILYLEEEHCKWADHPSFAQHDVRISLHTVRGHARTLKALASWLYREEYLPENVLARLRLPKAPKVDIKILSDDEIRRIFGALDPDISSGARNYAIVLLMLDSGLRVGEVVSLRLSKTDLEHGRLWVDGKGSKERLVPIGVRCQRYLNRYMTHFRPRPMRPSIENVFLNLDGTPVGENSEVVPGIRTGC